MRDQVHFGKIMGDIFNITEKPQNSPALLSDGGIAVTYGELQRQIEIIGKKISGRCLIFFMCKNEPGSVVGYAGALGNEAVPLLLDEGLKEAQLERLFDIYRPSYIWASAEWGKTHPQYVQKMVYETYDFGLWETGLTPYPLYPELGVLLATSGSTGDPKLVRLSYQNLVANAASICEYLHLNQSERPITTLPMQYSYGLSIINSHLLAGACILMTTASLVQTAFWDLFEKEQATSFGGVPYTYEILKRIHLFQKKLPSLRTITQAGGRLPVTLQKEVALWAEEQGISFYVMYGQTEATARMSYLPPERCLEKPGSIGRTIPGGKFYLADEAGKEIQGDDRIGELVYEGENVSLGYAQNREDLLLGDVRRGVLHTGDLARRDADGYYYIEGRQKRFVKIFGVRVSMDACEKILRERHPGVELACAGQDDCLKIYVKREPCEDENERLSATIIQELTEILQINRRGFRCFMVDEIPKTDSGKINYAQLASYDT